MDFLSALFHSFMEKSYLFTHNCVKKNMQAFLYPELTVFCFSTAQLEFQDIFSYCYFIQKHIATQDGFFSFFLCIMF